MNNNLNDIFKLFNNLRNVQEKQNAIITNDNKNKMNQLVFGEELSTFIPVVNKNNARGVMTREQFEHVRSLSKDITLHLYGEPKFSTFIMGVYKEFFDSRVTQGFKGMKGMSMKGIICAILYLIMLYEHKAKLSIRKLITAANQVKSASTSQVTERMIYKYINIVIDHLKAYSDNKNTKNKLSNVDYSIDQAIKTLAFSIGYESKHLSKMRKLLSKIPDSLKNQHIPHHIAVCIIYHFATVEDNFDSIDKTNLLKKLNMSPYILKKVYPKFQKQFVKTYNISLK